MPGLKLAATLCGIALASPFWVGRLVPLLDLPQHLAVVAVLRHHGDPDWGFSRFFDVEWGELTPYWTHYLVTWALSHLVPVETASRLYGEGHDLSPSLAACTVGAMTSARSPWMARVMTVGSLTETK